MGFPRKSILAVGMLPPPYGGQALMFEWAVEFLRSRFELSVVNLQAQTNLGASGRLSVGKFLAFLKILWRCLRFALREEKCDILYYCPSGPSHIGLLKDLAILTILRPRTKKIVYHFHGTGGIDFLIRKHPHLIWWARRVMFSPDLSIRCASVEPDDATLCLSRKVVIVPNGVPDPLGKLDLADHEDGQPLRFCFMGALTAEKGIFDLIRACQILVAFYPDLVLDVIGEGMPDEVKAFDDLVRACKLEGNVYRHGVVVGAGKFAILSQAKLLLFPTYFRAESQPLVVIEAAAVGVPAVVSDWRGLNSIIIDGVTGALVPPRDPSAFAAKVRALIDTGGLDTMRLAARQHYLENFTQSAFFTRLEQALELVTGTYPH